MIHPLFMAYLSTPSSSHCLTRNCYFFLPHRLLAFLNSFLFTRNFFLADGQPATGCCPSSTPSYYCGSLPSGSFGQDGGSQSGAHPQPLSSLIFCLFIAACLLGTMPPIPLRPQFRLWRKILVFSSPSRGGTGPWPPLLLP